MSIARLGVGFCGLVLLFVVSCGTSDDSGRSYTDNQGRVCTADLRATNERAVCNIEAAPTNGCAMGQPCFMVHATLDIGQLQNCESCCVGTTPSFPNGLDCAPITCRTAEDCPHAQPVCQGSFCFARAKNPGAGGNGGSAPVGGAGAPSGGATGGAAPGGTAGFPTTGGTGMGGGGAATSGASGSPFAGSGGVFQSSGGSGAGFPGGGAFGSPAAGSSGFSAAGASGSSTGGRSGFPFGP